jgi:hypothetical protein
VTTSYLESKLSNPQALTYHANQVKALCHSMAGTTIEIAQARKGAETFFVAGINSAGCWNDAQRALLQSWQVRIVEPVLRRDRELTKQRARYHAEENIGIYLNSIGAVGLRWSRAVVGACYQTKSGSNSYVCKQCQSMIKLVGGVIEPPWGMSA